MFISRLQKAVLERLCNEIYQQCRDSVSFITKEDIQEALGEVYDANNLNGGKGEFCIAMENLRYNFSVILSEVRQKKREIMAALFEEKPELSKEKSVLKEKLDAVPEYAKVHMQEELLFQLIEHLQSLQNTVTYLFKEANDG